MFLNLGTSVWYHFFPWPPIWWYDEKWWKKFFGFARLKERKSYELFLLSAMTKFSILTYFWRKTKLDNYKNWFTVEMFSDPNSSFLTLQPWQSQKWLKQILSKLPKIKEFCKAVFSIVNWVEQKNLHKLLSYFSMTAAGEQEMCWDLSVIASRL